MELTKGKLLLIYNPHAGQGMIQQNLAHIIHLLTHSGFLVTTYPTQCRDDAKDFIIKAAEDFDVVIASGGDGTLHEVINGMMELPKEKQRPLGYIPAGSTNDFAASHQIPKNMMDSVKQIVRGTPAPIDVGEFHIRQSDTEEPSRRFFSYVAAFGSFTDITYDTPQEMKKRLGYFAYVLMGAKRLPEYHPYHLKINADGEEIEGDFQVGMIANTTHVAGFPIKAGDISMHDGMAELILVRAGKSQLNNLVLMQTILMQDFSSPQVVYRKAHRITVESSTPLSWTLDGEYGGSTRKAELTTRKDALEFITATEQA